MVPSWFWYFQPLCYLYILFFLLFKSVQFTFAVRLITPLCSKSFCINVTWNWSKEIICRFSSSLMDQNLDVLRKGPLKTFSIRQMANKKNKRPTKLIAECGTNKRFKFNRHLEVFREQQFKNMNQTNVSNKKFTNFQREFFVRCIFTAKLSSHLSRLSNHSKISLFCKFLFDLSFQGSLQE